MNECTYKNYDELPLMLNVVQVAAVLGCSPDQLFFTSGGTEGDNFAVFSVAQRYHKRGRHIITTAVEHHVCFVPFRHWKHRGLK